MPNMPGTDIPLFSMKPGDAGVHLAGAAAFMLLGLYGGARDDRDSRSARSASVLGPLVVSLVFVAALNRGGFLAVLAALFVVGALEPAAVGKTAGRVRDDGGRRGGRDRARVGRPSRHVARGSRHRRARVLAAPGGRERRQHRRPRVANAATSRARRNGVSIGGARSSTTRCSAAISGRARVSASTWPTMTDFRWRRTIEAPLAQPAQRAT